ncbi:MAG: SDR family oxidoreductase [Methanoregulaceae archaeon]|jgi:UDP-glucose 4-epimerase|nr:SDR family oxidoreductase [Methanoregulaceae archaeon]
MKIVVTGGAGFIGSHIAEFLSDLYDVTVIDDLTTGNSNNLVGLPLNFVNGSIEDNLLLKKEFKDAHYVVHHAAFVSVPDSIKYPRKNNDINITGTLNVLCAARDAGVEKVIFASSAAIYGNSLELPKREDMIPEPVSPYAASKMAGEHYCRVFNEQYGLKTLSLRYFNVYGPRQNPSSDYAAVIPLFITRMLSQKPLVIYGDGTQTRDFIFVRDVVSAIKSGLADNINGTYNIATGKKTSINDLIELLRDLLDIEPTISNAPPRPGDIHDSFADISLARNKFGFQTRYSTRDGLKETIEWFGKCI